MHAFFLMDKQDQEKHILFKEVPLFQMNMD